MSCDVCGGSGILNVEYREASDEGGEWTPAVEWCGGDYWQGNWYPCENGTMWRAILFTVAFA